MCMHMHMYTQVSSPHLGVRLCLISSGSGQRVSVTVGLSPRGPVSGAWTFSSPINVVSSFLI